MNINLQELLCAKSFFTSDLKAEWSSLPGRYCAKRIVQICLENALLATEWGKCLCSLPGN